MVSRRMVCQRQLGIDSTVWCTLKLWESHWWQSFSIFLWACFTVDRSTFGTLV